jgi:hypothetical protein
MNDYFTGSSTEKGVGNTAVNVTVNTILRVYYFISVSPYLFWFLRFSRFATVCKIVFFFGCSPASI